MNVQPRKLRIAVALIAGFALVAADEGWAGGGRGARRGGGHKSGFAATFAGAGATQPRGGLGLGGVVRPMPVRGYPQRHHHHGRAVLFIGAPFLFYSWPYGYYYAPPPYYYGPDYSRAHEELPGIYVEKFEGTPTPETPGDIFCPSKAAYYPDVQDCPGGWQRVIREQGAETPSNSG
jgi:hypothetical protein